MKTAKDLQIRICSIAAVDAYNRLAVSGTTFDGDDFKKQAYNLFHGVAGESMKDEVS